MSFLTWLFGRRTVEDSIVPLRAAPQQLPARDPAPLEQTALVRDFPFAVIADGDSVPDGWYQRADWSNKNFISYRGGRPPQGWKQTRHHEVKIAGLSFGTRSLDFLQIAPSPDFLLCVEEEPDNPVNPHARKVMASGTVNGTPVKRHIGYLPDAIATKYAGVDLRICPRKAFLPPSRDLNLGVEIEVFVPSTPRNPKSP
jgi:hypothetical protein